MNPRSPRDAFLEAAFWHGSRPAADALLAAHPEIAGADIHVAAMLGDAAAVRRFLAADPGAVHSHSGPRDAEPLVHLCFSVYLRDPARNDGFIDAATALLDAGADANGGFFDASHQPEPTRESLLYGAAGVHFNADLTRLLLARGADPNDDEVPYHSVEGPHNDAFRVLLESGAMNARSLAMMLLRKTDWHDEEGVRLLLDHGVDPNARTPWGKTALHNAILSDNGIRIVDLLLDRGANPTLVAENAGRNDPAFMNRSAVALAAIRGRADALQSFRRHGFPIELAGLEALAAACALDDGVAADDLLRRDPSLRDSLRAEGGALLARFAGTANAAGVARLLDLGVPVDARFAGEPYFAIAPDSTALHVAAWRAWQPVIELLLARGADVNARDAQGRTPLMLAVAAATRSYWAMRRTPDGVRALLAAGASAAGITLPTGYDAIDALLGPSR